MTRRRSRVAMEKGVRGLHEASGCFYDDANQVSVKLVPLLVRTEGSARVVPLLFIMVIRWMLLEPNDPMPPVAPLIVA